MSSTRAGGPGPRSGLVGSQVAYSAVGPLLVVEADPVGDDDASFGERIELLAVEALVTEAGVKGFDVTVLPGRAGVDVERADAAVGQAVPDGTGDKLGAVVGADMLRRSVGFDCLGEDSHDVVSADAAGDVVGDALLRVLVDEHQGPEATSPGVVTVGWFSKVDRVTLNGASLNVTGVPSYQTAAKMRDAGLKVQLSQIVPLAVGSPTEENFPDC